MGLPARTTVTTALRVTLRTALAACALATLPGCAAGDPRAGPDARPSATPSPTPSPTSPTARSPVDLCVDLVAYWVKEALVGSKWAGLDWEQKGLSNEQLVIHDEVLALARAKERAAGREAAASFADEETRRRCAAANGATGSSENWKPPP
ncbi:hypothetical protein [Streptomyces sp. NPDC058579]|uniref:hypothetical protein n=1 Tax=Streptomyces sp. NPDC058579 TaxID=3346548 RepID=UPI00365A7E11